jgi:hypothetical protein
MLSILNIATPNRANASKITQILIQRIRNIKLRICKCSVRCTGEVKVVFVASKRLTFNVNYVCHFAAN